MKRAFCWHCGERIVSIDGWIHVESGSQTCLRRYVAEPPPGPWRKGAA